MNHRLAYKILQEQLGKTLSDVILDSLETHFKPASRYAFLKITLVPDYLETPEELLKALQPMLTERQAQELIDLEEIVVVSNEALARMADTPFQANPFVTITYVVGV